jgi:hypothetical protein
MQQFWTREGQQMSTEINSSTENVTLNSKQLHAIRLLVTGGKLKHVIAEEVGVTPETLSRWNQQPAFVAELNKARVEAHEATMQGIRNLAMKGLETLEKLLNSTNEKVQQTTAQALLDIYLKLAKPSGPTSREDVLAKQELDDANRKMFSDLAKIIGG